MTLQKVMQIKRQPKQISKDIIVDISDTKYKVLREVTNQYT